MNNDEDESTAKRRKLSSSQEWRRKKKKFQRHIVSLYGYYSILYVFRAKKRMDDVNVEKPCILIWAHLRYSSDIMADCISSLF